MKNLTLDNGIEVFGRRLKNGTVIVLTAEDGEYVSATNLYWDDLNIIENMNIVINEDIDQRCILTIETAKEINLTLED